MKDKAILQDLNDVVEKLTIRIIYYQTEIKKLNKKIEELKKYVKEK